jgi:signal transduction histidine kinase
VSRGATEPERGGSAADEGAPQVGDLVFGAGVVSPPLRSAAERAVRTQAPVRSGESLAVPILLEQRVLGALAVAGSFMPQEEALVGRIAQQTALALENVRLLAATRAACDAKDAVLAVASHEISSPLAALAGYADLLSRVLEDPEPSHAALSRIAAGLHKTTTRVQDLSRRLLDSERIRTGQLVMERKPTDLLPTLRDVIERASIGFERAIMFEPHATVLPGQWDLVRLEEVMTNLISNAIRYSPQETPVRVTIQLLPGGAGARTEVVLTVEDCGIGIPDADREHVFTAFRRGSNARVGGPGLGLGLHVAAEIVRAHGGRIWFDTESGRGTTFYVALPLE